MPKLIKENDKRITIRLPEGMLIEIKRQAAEKSQPVGRFIRDTIASCLAI